MSSTFGLGDSRRRHRLHGCPCGTRHHSRSASHNSRRPI